MYERKGTFIYKDSRKAYKHLEIATYYGYDAIVRDNGRILVVIVG